MKRFKCPNCDQKFSIEQKDFEEYYSKMENIQCTCCGKIFNIQHAISLSCNELKVENKKNEKIGCGCLVFIVIAIFCILASCQTGSETDYEKQQKKEEKNTENAAMMTAHIMAYHSYLTKIDLGRIRVSPWSGKIDCDYCDRLNKIKGNY